MNFFGVILTTLSNVLGAEEAALKLLLSVLSGYPLAIFYRKHVYGSEKHLSHLYFIATGFMLGYLNYGNDVFHPFFSMFATYAILVIFGGTFLSATLVFTFNMLYLLIGYYVMSTDSYDINWTMPHCVLTLRLIGIAFDYYDGHRDESTLGNDNKNFMLKELPPLLEFLGYCSFPASFMVGPQFPMRRYRDFIDGEFGDKKNLKEPPQSEAAAYQRLMLGVLYMVLFQILGMFVSDDMILNENFNNFSFTWKHVLLGLWGRYTLYRYITCWLLAEGACILFGITYNGQDPNGDKLWNGCENVKLSIIENTTEFNNYVHSFNINTNKWLAHYIYKRLKFLNNRNLSQLGALFFLAVWHGYHSGYFVCFFLEFIVIYFERDIKSIVKSNEVLTNFFANEIVENIMKIILRIYTFVFMGFCLTPFVLLTFDRYWAAFGAINYSGLILFGLYPFIWGPLLRFAFKKKRKD